MSIIDRLRLRKKNTASIAKERLQIIVAHERSKRANDPEFLSRLQKEIVQVIAKYVHIDEDQVKVQLEQQGERSILELNITLPESVES